MLVFVAAIHQCLSAMPVEAVRICTSLFSISNTNMKIENLLNWRDTGAASCTILKHRVILDDYKVMFGMEGKIL